MFLKYQILEKIKNWKLISKYFVTKLFKKIVLPYIQIVKKNLILEIMSSAF